MVVSFLGGYFRKVCLFDFKRLCVCLFPVLGGIFILFQQGTFLLILGGHACVFVQIRFV